MYTSPPTVRWCITISLEEQFSLTNKKHKQGLYHSVYSEIFAEYEYSFKITIEIGVYNVHNSIDLLKHLPWASEQAIDEGIFKRKAQDYHAKHWGQEKQM